jgi:hypothetical protein
MGWAIGAGGAGGAAEAGSGVCARAAVPASNVVATIRNFFMGVPLLNQNSIRVNSTKLYRA